MTTRITTDQERGLIALIAVAIIAVGVTLYLPVVHRPRISTAAPITVANVHVIAPQFLSSRPQVDVNRAGIDELTRLPGIGPTLAARIIAYRTAHGSFTQVKELTLVPGIGNKTLARIRKLITVIPEKNER